MTVDSDLLDVILNIVVSVIGYFGGYSHGKRRIRRVMKAGDDNARKI